MFQQQQNLGRIFGDIKMRLSPLHPHPVAWVAVRSKAVAVLLLIYCSMSSPLFVGVLCLPLFWYALLCLISSFAIKLKRKRELVALLLLPYRFLVTVNVLWLFLTMPWFCMQFVIEELPDKIQFFNKKDFQRLKITHYLLMIRNNNSVLPINILPLGSN